MELSKGTKQIFEQMKNSGYDMFNINDPFYQDICTPFDSSNGTDILLTDRIDYIYHNDDTQCQSNCEYSQYSVDSQYLSCSCSINEDANNEHKKSDKFNSKKIYESFYEVLKYSNYDILKCYNIILSINVIKINMGSIIVILYFSCYLTCLIIFMFRGLIPLKIKLRNDIYKEQKKHNLVFKFNIHKVLNPPIKSKLNNKSIPKKFPQKKRGIIFNKNINKFKFNDKNKIGQILKMNLNSNSKSSSIYNVLDKTPIKSLFNAQIKGKSKYNNKSIENQLKRDLSDYEINELEYEEAIKFDKRSVFKIYWQILQREHLIFFTFFNYRNTQKAFIKDSIISFSICLAYPFLIYFVSALLQYCSLRDSKKRCKCVYNFSYVIPFF